MIPKFRVYDKRLKLIRTLNYIDFEGKEILYDITDEAPSEIVRDFNEVEIMQSTGLKDSNGKEIYEGDIIEYNDNNSQKSGGYADDTIHKGVVEYECGAFWIEGELLFDVVINDSELGILGNIYENAELLEVTE